MDDISVWRVYRSKHEDDDLFPSQANTIVSISSRAAWAKAGESIRHIQYMDPFSQGPYGFGW